MALRRAADYYHFRRRRRAIAELPDFLADKVALTAAGSFSDRLSKNQKDAYRVFANTAGQPEQDIGFNPNTHEINTQQLQSFSDSNGGADLHVVRLYDATGNGHDWVQSTNSYCPKVWDGVDGLVVNSAGNPAAEFVSASQQHMISTANCGSLYTLYIVGQVDDTNDNTYCSQRSTTDINPVAGQIQAYAGANSDPIRYAIRDDAGNLNLQSSVNYSVSTQFIHRFFDNSTLAELAINGVVEASASVALGTRTLSGNFVLGGIISVGGLERTLQGRVSEIILAPADTRGGLIDTELASRY